MNLPVFSAHILNNYSDSAKLFCNRLFQLECIINVSLAINSKETTFNDWR